MKIFISSTYGDLIEQRKVVHDTIRKMGYESIRMEDFAANGKHPRDFCLEKVRECDAVILLIGSLYGNSRDYKTGLSYTHLEYISARDKRIPVLAFLKKPEKGKWESAETDEVSHKNHLNFKNDVEEHVIRLPFSSLQELERILHEAIHNHAREHGWIGTPRSAFQTVDEFYKPFLNPDFFFHHTLPLIGRANELNTLTDFSNSAKQIALLPGPDGIGKSRLLLEALRQIENEQKGPKVFMLRSTFAQANDHELPGGQILIGVDDALTRDIKSLDELIKMTRSYTGRVKLILAIRQEDLEEIKRHLISANFQTEELLVLPLLKEVENPVELAKAILGKEDLNQISQLVALASDSPLIMVMVGELLKRGQIRHTILASSHDDFRQEVILRYQQILPGSTIFPIPNEKVLKVRELLYAIGPLDTSNASLITKAATFLQVTRDQFLETLDRLEKAGMVTRRRDSYSSIPDALAYPVLEKACFTDSDRVKEFGPRIAVEFTEPSQTNALKRLAEVDWLKGKGHDTRLLTQFWQQLNDQFLVGSFEERINILRIVNDVAYLQPKVALNFVEMALRIPDLTQSESGNDQSMNEQAKLYLPSILGQIARHVDYTKAAIHLLWILGKDDYYKDISRSSNHPHQLLEALSKQKYGQIVAFSDAYLQSIENWYREVDAFDRDFTPLNLIPNFLTRDGYEDFFFSQTMSIHIQPFYILPEPMKDIRKRALHLLVSVSQMNTKPKLQYHAVEVLRNIIIRGLLYNNAPELRAQWLEEDRTILTELSGIAQKAKSTFITYSIEYGLRIALKHPENAPLAENIRATLATLPLDLDTEIIWYWMHGKSAKQFSGEQADEYEGSNDEIERVVAEHVLQTCSTAQSLKKKLDELCSHLALYNHQIVHPHFLELLTEIDPVSGYELCRLLVDDPRSRTADYFTYLVLPIRKWNTTTFLDLIRDALKSDNSSLNHGAAYAICAFTDCTDEESNMIITLIKDADPIIATRAIYAIHRLPEKAQDKAFSVLSDVSITSQDERKVDAICEALCQRINYLTWDPIPFMTSFLQKCVTLPELSEKKHYRLCSLLMECRWKYPQIIADFCLDRVKYWRLLPEEQKNWYEPISCISTHIVPTIGPADEQHIEERYKVLCTIRDELLTFEGSEIMTIFAYLANGYDRITQLALSEWLESGEERKIRLVAKLIRNAPTTFVFGNEDFVERLLNIAVRINKNFSEQMSASLLSCAMPFAYGGVPDLLSNARIQMRDRARQIADQYPSNSVMREFYTDLMKEAEYRIEMQRTFMAE